MSLMRNCSLGDSSDCYSVTFDDLSIQAQEKLFTIKQGDTLWKLLPLAQLYEDKNSLTQDEIDDAALLTAGYYR